MGEKKIGVLVMSYGTPQSLEQIEEYYTHIRHGRPPSEEQLAELAGRYKAIVGGVFPLRENTNRQVAELESALNRAYGDSGTRFICYQGLKHAAPFIEDGVMQMAADGITEGVGFVLAPHYSIMSVGDYTKRAKEAADSLGLQMRFIRDYHLHPGLLEAWAKRVTRALDKFDDAGRGDVHVLFSAHSLPEKILEMKDPYPDQLLETARAIADRVRLSQWQFAWQSAGRTSVPWLGPDILDVIRDLHEKEVRRILVCPIGFVSDHLEVLYDIDIECAGLAEQLGIQLERTESLNTDPEFIAVLAEITAETAGAAGRIS